ncbi:MAG: TolC family outer membrane protein [Alphaproteobacteria bacterium]|nr:TolC family outer membrane protein [Alphaproteobacteria bacterium]
MTIFKKTCQTLVLTTALTVGGFASTAVHAADVHAIDTLKEAVAVGIETNPETGVVENSRRATDEELRQAKALYYPSVDLDADTGFEWTDDAGTRARTGDDESLYRYQVGLTLTQMLFDGYETLYENDRQTHRVRSASHRVRETEEFVGLDIIEAYLDVVRQRKLLNIARENVGQHVNILRRIEDGADAGRSTKADVEQVRARLAASKANEANVVEALRIAEASYDREVGDMPGNLRMPVAPVDALTSDVEEEVKVTLTHSPTLDIFEADVNVAEAEWRGTGSTLYPQIDLQLAARRTDNVGGIEEDDESASALVTMDWNLFRGGADKARVKEFVYRHAQAKERRNDAARAIEDDVRQTWAQMLAAGERAKQFTSQAAANQQVVRAYMDQFELDRRTLLDVLDAQNELFVSRSNALNNEVLEMFAVYRLLSLKGELLPTMDIAYQAEVDPDDNY